MSLQNLMALSKERAAEKVWGGNEDYSLLQEMRELNELLEHIREHFCPDSAELNRYIAETAKAWD